MQTQRHQTREAIPNPSCKKLRKTGANVRCHTQNKNSNEYSSNDCKKKMNEKYKMKYQQIFTDNLENDN